MDATPHLESHETQVGLAAVGNARDPRSAMEAFRAHAPALRDWRILFADEQDLGPLKLTHRKLSGDGMHRSLFRGRSLWVLDEQSVFASGQTRFRHGRSTFLDTNAASHIRSMAYAEHPALKVIEAGRGMDELAADYVEFNSALYRWEVSRNWNAITQAKCKETLAALHGLLCSGGPLNPEWGRRYRSMLQPQCEQIAQFLMNDFQAELDGGLDAGLEEHLLAVEAMLVRCKLLELGSQKSAQHKLAELIRFMHDDLATIMLRELKVCAALLARRPGFSLVDKLNSLQDRPDHVEVLKNCAWDLYIPRALDRLSASASDPCLEMHFVLANVISFDADVIDVIQATQLNSLAIHRRSDAALPFFEDDSLEWLQTTVGDKRMSTLASMLDRDAIEHRARSRSVTRVREILAYDHAELAALLADARARNAARSTQRQGNDPHK